MSIDLTSDTAPRRRSRLTIFILTALVLLSIAALLALGTWQVKRLSWKLDLIARVDSRVHADPVAPPTMPAWGSVNPQDDEYRHVRVNGVFLNARETLVYASTALGPGAWVMTPLKLSDGTTIIINRGFVPTDKRDVATRSAGNLEGDTTVTGLLRMTEPEGSLLQANLPSENRWYSRDVAAMAETHRLGQTAPYFIDADATLNPGGLPLGGLTVVKFPNSHLVYAITWYALAAMLAGAMIFVVRRERRGHPAGS
jgi:surfeit locus 1 family protein